MFKLYIIAVLAVLAETGNRGLMATIISQVQVCWLAYILWQVLILAGFGSFKSSQKVSYLSPPG